MGVSDTTEKDWEEHYKEEMIMDNEFFNFDAVVEIEKKKSYNQALEDFETKMAYFCFGLRASEGNLCRVDVVEDELQRIKRQLKK